MKINIMWYNIKRGFHKKEAGDYSTFQPERMKAAQQIISDFNPDILVLGEADFNPKCKEFGEVKKVMNYQEIFNYPHVFYSAVTSRKGEAVLSKIPIKAKSYSIEMFSHLKINFVVSKKEIRIDVIHPHPKIPEKEKAVKIKTIFKKIPSDYILLGDFNALSPEDKYTIKEVTEGFKPARGEDAKNNALDALQCLVVKEVLNKGLIDTYRLKNKERGDTIPTKAFSPFKDNFGDMRLDYIFCSKDFKVLESRIIKNKLTEMASDHYPIYAVLELK